MKAKIFVGPQSSGKTMMAALISEYVGKDKTAIVSGADKHIYSHFAFANIPDDTELLIIDDCSSDFDYTHFFPVEDNQFTGGDLKFIITKHCRGESPKHLTIPFLIFIANEIDPRVKDFGMSFSARFDIVSFEHAMDGIGLIAKERREQIEKHDFTLDHDKKYNCMSQLPGAAAFLCTMSEYPEELIEIVEETCPPGWNPVIWDHMIKKPELDRLVIAGALIAAEIDRLQSINPSVNQ